LAATLACGGRSNQGLEATVNAVNTAVELTLAAITPNAPGTDPAPALSSTPSAPTSGAPLPTDTSPAASSTAPPTPDEAAATPTPNPTANELARPNGAVMSAIRRDTPPNLDGNQDDWPAELPYTIDQIVFGAASWVGATDQSGSFNVMWDADNLYLYVVVADDVHAQSDSGQTLYRGDSLELQLDADLAGDFSEASLNGDDYQIGFSPGATRENPEVYFWNPVGRRGSPTGIDLGTRANGAAGGYIAEIAIPWSLFGVTPAAGSRFGFALNSSDNDSPGATEQQSMLSSVITRRLLDPTTWGTLELVNSN
jgi:hypothetical protein